jgi:hypothetical protein
LRHLERGTVSSVAGQKRVWWREQYAENRTCRAVTEWGAIRAFDDLHHLPVRSRRASVRATGRRGYPATRNGYCEKTKDRTDGLFTRLAGFADNGTPLPCGSNPCKGQSDRSGHLTMRGPCRTGAAGETKAKRTAENIECRSQLGDQSVSDEAPKARETAGMRSSRRAGRDAGPLFNLTSRMSAFERRSGRSTAAMGKTIDS